MTFKLGGFKPTPDDFVYNKFGAVRNEITKFGVVTGGSEYRIPQHTPISNQGGLNSCVANATCDALEIIHGLQNPTSVEQLSRLFVYWNARLYSKDTDQDQGTHIHSAFDSLQEYGVCPESEWPYSQAMVFAQPSIRAYKTANDNTIANYYRIDTYESQRLFDIEMAVRANHPVVFGTGVNQAFQDYRGGGTVWGPPDKRLGLHAMIVVGVRRNPDIEFLIRNSWGYGWGDNGHCWMNASYMLSSDTTDLWVPTKMESLLL